jgi:hypothetical protein
MHLVVLSVLAVPLVVLVVLPMHLVVLSVLAVPLVVLVVLPALAVHVVIWWCW